MTIADTYRRFAQTLWRQPSRLQRYLLPFYAIATCLFLQATIQAVVGKERDFPYALFYLVAVMLVAWIGGYAPGAIAATLVVVGLPAAADPSFTVQSIDPARVLLIIAVSLLITKVANMQRQARAKLASLNEGLEVRVQQRTNDLEKAVSALEEEVAQHRNTEARLKVQLERLNLLDQITRAIGERQDLGSVFQVVVRSVEEHLPVDFCSLCLHDPDAVEVKVACVGLNSASVALDLALTEQAHVPIDQNGLSQCVQGRLVYEPDISTVSFPFPQRLAKGGLRSLVIAPLLVESQVFGVLVAARKEAEAFSSSDCEFLRQLCEHAALASQQAQVHAALQQAYEDLRQSQQTVMQQERLRALGQMASGIAHDINNAVSPVALYTDLILESETNISPKMRKYLETTRCAIEDVADTVARMREFYRKPEPAAPVAVVDVNQVIRQVLDLTEARWSDMAQKRGVFVDPRLELDADLLPVLGVESDLREALLNLVINAVDAMPEGGVLTLRTRITADDTGKTIEVEVIDEGVGMTEETRRRCLEPFYTTKGERGTGLGLAGVYGAVQRHRGEIEIESTLGAGTTVRLRLPAAVASNGLLGLHQATTIVPERMRILVVDDDPLLIKSLRDTLETDGHLVVTANGGQEGINAFQASLQGGERFRVVITDLGMPHIDGRRVARAIKESSPTTPVVLLTGWGQRLIAEGDVPPHVDRVLNKPPKLRDLRRALSELAGQNEEGLHTRTLLAQGNQSTLES